MALVCLRGRAARQRLGNSRWEEPRRHASRRRGRDESFHRRVSQSTAMWRAMRSGISHPCTVAGACRGGVDIQSLHTDEGTAVYFHENESASVQ